MPLPTSSVARRGPSLTTRDRYDLGKALASQRQRIVTTGARFVPTYEAGHSFVECREKFGFSGGSWSKAIERGDILPREKGVGSYISRRAFKRRLTRDKVLSECCAECGISEWRGRRLVLELHHVNGKKDDHRLENVVLLCPNCHSQTDTYRTKNRARSGVA
jgi:hypothetical protein